MAGKATHTSRLAFLHLFAHLDGINRVSSPVPRGVESAAGEGPRGR